MAANDCFETAYTTSLESTDDFATNPANGLSMVGGCSGLDLCGNLYGSDLTDAGFGLIEPMGVDNFWDQ